MGKILRIFDSGDSESTDYDVQMHVCGCSRGQCTISVDWTGLDECVNAIAVQLVKYAQNFAQNTFWNFLKISLVIFFQCSYYACPFCEMNTLLE